jgi:flagellar biosynthesis/type III secretory pathway chaperone
MTTDLDNDLVARFEQRIALLEEVLELAGRQRKAIEQGKAARLDRLIDRREYAMRRWRELEQAIGHELEAAKDATPSDEQQARVRALIDSSEDLAKLIQHEDALLAETIEARHEAIASELAGLRRGRETLQAYAHDPGPGTTQGIDKNA